MSSDTEADTTEELLQICKDLQLQLNKCLKMLEEKDEMIENYKELVKRVIKL